MTAPTILVADDQPLNLQILQRKLEQSGLHVVSATTGEEALQRVAAAAPDLILLDVLMPGLSGIEVCQRLQADERTRSIPIIFITAQDTKEGLIHGLGAGAVDYLTKPIDLDEMLARVRTQLRVVEISREMVDLQRRLEEARRATTVGAMTQGIAHNLNNLLGVVMGYIELIKSSADRPDSVRRHVTSVEEAVGRIVNIIRQLTGLVGNSRLPTLPTPLSRMLDGAIRRYHADYKLSAPVTVDNPLGDIAVFTHTEVFEEAVSKILINAWESYGHAAPDARPITLRTTLTERAPYGRCVEIQVIDHGNGVPRDLRDSIFEPFVSSKQTVGVGMGLTIARHSLRNLGGEVFIHDGADGGTIATIRHPIERRRPPEPVLMFPTP